MKKTKEGRSVFSWMNPCLEVRSISKYGNNGKGIFTLKEIKKGEELAVFGGYIVAVKDLIDLPEKYRDLGFQISDKFSITSKNINEDSDNFNHSCDPNAGICGQIFLVSMRDIKKGEEVVFDYAMVLSKSTGAEKYEIKCLCGSVKCRGKITENDWKMPELQKKYNGYFQHFLQEKINKINTKK
ncbi:MAG: SET domain-containing protein [Candidatus Moranbacteria bacterium]|nr:SET domain-containing protein [Candidatus Moranbacteria bacterium]